VRSCGNYLGLGRVPPDDGLGIGGEDWGLGAVGVVADLFHIRERCLDGVQFFESTVSTSGEVGG